MADTWKNVGSLRKSKSGGLYIKINEGVTLAKDDVLQLQDPRKKLQASAEAGRMSQEEATERINKIPDYVRYDVTLPPPKKG